MGKFSRGQIDELTIFSYFSQKTEFDISCKLSPLLHSQKIEFDISCKLSPMECSKYFLTLWLILFEHTSYGKCPKILYTKVSVKIVYTYCEDPDQMSDQGLHCLPFH